MIDSLKTPLTLLLRMKDPDDEAAWARFVRIYEPLILRFAKQRGLQQADAEDVCQEVLSAVAKVVLKWEHDPEQGSFRAWLFTVVRHWSLKNHNGRFRFPLLPGDEHINERIEAFPDASPDEVKRFSDEYRRKMVLWAAEQVRPDFKESTWEAFWKTAIQHVSVKQVSASLQMSEGAVYIARSRVMAAIKKVVAELDGDLDFPSEAPDAG